MANDGSLQSGGKTKFNLQTQAGVLQVLTTVRNSDLPTEERNELRDLVFLLSNGGGDPAVRTALEDRLVALGLTEPISTPKQEAGNGAESAATDQSKSQPSNGFAGTRPTPTFSASVKPATVQSSPKSNDSGTTATTTQSTQPAPKATTPPPPPEPANAPKQTSSSIPQPATPSDSVPQVKPAQPSVTPSASSKSAPASAPQSIPANLNAAPSNPALEQKHNPPEPTVQPVSSPTRSAPPNPPKAANSRPATSVSPDMVPSTTTEKPQTEVSQSAQASNVPPISAKPAPQTAEPRSTKATGTPASTVTQPAATSAATGAQNPDALTRIREIKADINGRVGNPVNLVEIDNRAGRDYMNALLEAMRSVSGGTPQTAQSALDTLEAAYQNILPLIEQYQASGPESSTADAHQDTTIVPPRPQKDDTRTPVPSAPLAQANVGTPDQTQKSVSGAPTEQAQKLPTDTPNASEIPQSKPAVTDDTLPTESVPATPSSVPTPTPTANAIPPAAGQSPQAYGANTVESQVKAPTVAASQQSPRAAQADDQTEKDSASPWAQALKGLKLKVLSNEEEDEDTTQNNDQQKPIAKHATESTVPPPSSSVQSAAPTQDGVQPASPITKNKVPYRKPSDLPESKQVISAEHGEDPLYSPAVDEGLNQLLQEWGLFKKSGFLGRGPNGREHPLFLKLAGLQIPLILAGRFEGANQEIKQSVTDYMNGWRYEQGIIYEPGETFEHYLRRVITHILGIES